MRAAAKQLLQSVTQRQTQLSADDISLQLPWHHMHDLITALDIAQDLSPQPVEPTVVREEPSGPEMFQCIHCDFFATDVASFRRHCTTAHGRRVTRNHFALASKFTNTGLPECQHCHQIFTTWRSFQTHIERGCQVLYFGPCATETRSALGTRAYMTGSALAASELVARGSSMLPASELANLRQTSFGHDLCQLIEARDWERLATLPEACQYLAKRCVLCGLHYNRVQELNAHYRTMHGQYWEGVPQRAVYMSNTWAQERPCVFCGALFKSHLCPVWVQVTALLLFGTGAPPAETGADEAPHINMRCDICMEIFPNQESLDEHLRTVHEVHGMAFNVARDSVAGEPACAHCGALCDNLSSLRSHINQSRCPLFRPEATAETLPIQPEWIQACLGGQMKVMFTNSRQRMVLTLHCQLCGMHYARATDLSCHLQGSHAKIWRRAQQLTLVLVRIFYGNGQCVCNPALHQNRLDHVCMPLRHLAMIYHRMDGQLFAPLQASEHTLSLLLSNSLLPSSKWLIEQVAAQHDFARLWQDSQCLDLLRNQCIFCGHESSACALPQHLREAHPCDHLALSFYMTQLSQLMFDHQQVDHQCYACQQIYNLPATADTAMDPSRKQLAQSHLLYNCPILLQLALFLTGLLNDGRLLDDSVRLAGPAASAGNVQGTGTSARFRSTGPQSKRAKTQQAQPRRSPTTSPAGSPRSTASGAAATAGTCPTAGIAGPSTRSRPQPKSQSGQLRTFFQPRSKGWASGIGECNTDVARAAQDNDSAHDDPETAPDAMSVPGLDGEGDEDFRSPGWRPIVPDLGSEPSDRQRGELAVSGMESSDQNLAHQQQDPHQHDSDDPARQGAGGNVQGPGIGHELQVTADEPGSTNMPMATSTESTGGPGMGAADPPFEMQPLDPDRDNAQASFPDPMRPCGHHPASSWPSSSKGEGKGQAQANPQPATEEMSPSLTVLLHVVSHLRLHNDANWCYANSTILCLLWTMMSMQCDTASLGAHFEVMIQFLPCHNLQLVALTDLAWFEQILQTWEAFTGAQRGQQQDASEFAAAVLKWLNAPAVNMYWERRMEETNVVRAMDHGETFMPITISFSAVNAHLPEMQFTLTDLVRHWMQADGMIAALTQAPSCLCLHLDRYYENDGCLQKSSCMINMEAGCDIPVFVDGTLRREAVAYVVIAATAHMGVDQGGHFQAILKTRPAVQVTGGPMHWLITNDGIAAKPTWQVPDWFSSCATVFWLLRADCVNLHTYQPLPQTLDDDLPDAPSDPEPKPPMQPKPKGSTELHMTSVPEPVPMDETTAAIMALLQATTMAERQR